jgi:hypothetical protein
MRKLHNLCWVVDYSKYQDSQYEWCFDSDISYLNHTELLSATSCSRVLKIGVLCT